MKQKLLLLGASIFAEDVAEIIHEGEQFELTGFVEGKNQEKCGKTRAGYPVFWITDIKEMTSSHLAVCAALSRKRKQFIKQALDLGLSFTNLIHPTAWLAQSVSLKEGTIINTRAVIAAQVRIGNHTIINRGALIGHHVEIGNYVTISPGANIASEVAIGESSYIGMGAVILNGISIGSNSIIGAGAVVTKDVPDNVQVLGVPARIVKELD